ncbi:PREDICTED: uncharacterized protein LOC104801017 [Tarenaya hassleriana]|uniref:uncharacterized protein LOC104801017 n=1 Tax=Tarenaya hassleriana TaxID=28532 RepID=UPI00053C173E|nr:PREDICTED: uncharacterized protein LOC104801017 [Tarenaya hassleriana]
MSVEILDGSTIFDFVQDEEAFNVSVTDRFKWLDSDQDGLLSYAEMVKEFGSLRVMEKHYGVDVKTEPEEISRVYGVIFEQFDRDANGKVDLDEFREETRRMMLAMAEGMGFLPVQMALEEGSFLMKAVERECSKLLLPPA